MSEAPEGPPAVDIDKLLADPKPGCARPIVGGLVLLLIAALLATIDDSVAVALALFLALGGVFLTLGGLFFLLSNIDEALRTHLLRQRASSREDD